jgi:hypothetical protein
MDLEAKLKGEAKGTTEGVQSVTEQEHINLRNQLSEETKYI